MGDAAKKYSNEEAKNYADSNNDLRAVIELEEKPRLWLVNDGSELQPANEEFPSFLAHFFSGLMYGTWLFFTTGVMRISQFFDTDDFTGDDRKNYDEWLELQMYRHYWW